jgi:hypothetical protein
VTDGALRQTELLGRERHASMPKGGIEGDQAIKGRQCTHHASMNKIHDDVNR